MSTATITTRTTAAPAAEAGAGAEAGAQPLPTVAAMRIPAWFFGFEAVLAGAFDILRAFPAAWPALVVLGLANLAVSLTVMRSRLRLAKLLWRGKGTRKVALGLLGLRIGVHLVLGVVGLAATSVIAHTALALAMSALTIALLAWTQRTALRALVAAGRVAA
ncbi:hypothetical protein [Kitasatospora sp. NPDC059571]|uniref:hypothetical protein n=1 Tax=Kitasatospora sp. NPDC059571 TaxID=3346871 RepID=UPI00369F66DB